MSFRSEPNTWRGGDTIAAGLQGPGTKLSLHVMFAYLKLPVLAHNTCLVAYTFKFSASSKLVIRLFMSEFAVRAQLQNRGGHQLCGAGQRRFEEVETASGDQWNWRSN